jgi:DNA-binding response OmpR family regulator
MGVEENIEKSDKQSARLGGAKADFVGTLGRRVAECSDLLRTLEASPDNDGVRDRLKRKLAALEVGARYLRFERLARSIQDATAVLQAKERSRKDFQALARLIRELPTLVWDGPEESAPQIEHATLTAVLVAGDADLCEMLGREPFSRRKFSCAHASTIADAEQQARGYAPDLIIVDADLEGAFAFVQTLYDDPWSETVPVIVVGTFSHHEQKAQYLSLGVTKLLAKPVLRTSLLVTAAQSLEQREGRTIQIALSEPTLEQLGERLAEEVRRSIVDVVDVRLRGETIRRNDEIWGSFLGAIARARDAISRSTSGRIRYPRTQAEAVTVVAGLLEHAPGSRRGAELPPDLDVPLEGCRVLVADDDPSITWFLADLLRAAGCDVHEASDGQQAFEIACRVSPHLVLSDIVMPNLDGLGLCRAMRRDPVLKHTPVILLSWKDDLLQRVRELGVGASGYLRKESDSSAILARVREVLHPRARVRARIAQEESAYGRIDGVGAVGLLEIVRETRPNARISVQDATFLYELELRRGVLIRASRVAPDGELLCGAAALRHLLGVSAARFLVISASDPLESEFGSDENGTAFAPFVVSSRAALAVCTGAKLAGVETVELDPEVVRDYLLATPDPARQVVRKLARGESPRRMLVTGEVPPSLVEDVLCELAVRGAVTAIRTSTGDDLLAIAHHDYATGQAGKKIRRLQALPDFDEASVEPLALSELPELPSGIALEAAGPSAVAEPAPEHEVEFAEHEISKESTEHEPPQPPGAIDKTIDEMVAALNALEETHGSPSSGPLAPAQLAEDSNWIDAADEAQSGTVPKPQAKNRPAPVSPASLPPVTVSAEDHPAGVPPKGKARAWAFLSMAITAVAVGAVIRTTLMHQGVPVANAAVEAPHAEVPRVDDKSPIPGLVVDVRKGTTSCQNETSQGSFLFDVPADAPIRIDGQTRGKGPSATIAAQMGSHDVRVGTPGKERTIVAEVRPCATTRVTWE